MSETGRSYAIKPGRSDGDTVRFGIVGTGYGLYGILPALRLQRKCDIVGICGSSPDRAHHLVTTRLPEQQRPPIFSSASELISAPGLHCLAIAVAPLQQQAVAREALARGIAVFAEKPLAVSLSAAEELYGCASRAGTAHMMDFIFPELESWRCARDVIATRKLGDTRRATIRWRFESHAHRFHTQTWKRDPSLGGGALRHFGSHVFYNLEFLLGRVKRIESASVTADRVTADVRLTSGVPVRLELDTACRTAHEHVVDVTFENGSLFLRNLTQDHCDGFQLEVTENRGGTRYAPQPDSPRQPSDQDSRVGPTARILSRFLDWVRGGPPSDPTFRAGLRVQCLIDAVERCACLGPQLCDSEA